MTTRSTRPIAIAAAAGLAGVAAFQVALALGAPLGRAAWGGAYTVLPTGLRAGSAGSAVFLTVATLIVFTYGRRPRPVAAALRWATRVLGGLLALSALANFASPSRWENFLMGPVALILAALCVLATARDDRRPEPGDGPPAPAAQRERR